MPFSLVSAMSFDLTNDAEQPPGQNFPGISPVTLRRIRNASVAVITLLFLFLILWWLRTVYTDWLWFDSLGFRSVYTKILVLKLWLFLGGTLVSGAVLLGNFYLANRFSRGPSTLAVNHGSMRLLWALTAAGVAITVISAAPIFGSVTQGRWETFLLLFNKVSFWVADRTQRPS